MPLNLQTHQVPEAIFFWDVIQQPHTHLHCRTTASVEQHAGIAVGVYSRSGLMGKTQAPPSVVRGRTALLTPRQCGPAHVLQQTYWKKARICRKPLVFLLTR